MDFRRMARGLEEVPRLFMQLCSHWEVPEGSTKTHKGRLHVLRDNTMVSFLMETKDDRPLPQAPLMVRNAFH